MSTPVSTLELIERIVRLELQQAPVEVLATQILGPLFEALNARAGALLCYRRDEGALALAAGRGLSAEGAERLGSLRWGGSGAWEMPLRALAERKAYLVESADLREFAAELVGPAEAATAMSVVGIPLHRWQQPVGIVLALADHPAETARVLEHALAYDVLAMALASALWGGPRAASIDESAAPPTLICEAWVDLRVRVADGAGASDGRVADRAVIDAMLQDLRGAVDALRAERRLEEAERTALAERLAAAEHDRAEHAARTASLERELGRHEALLAEARADLTRATSSAAPAPAPAAPAAAVATPKTARPAADKPAATPEQAAPPIAADASTAAPASVATRILDPDAARGEQIAAAIARVLPTPPPRGLVIANLFDADAKVLGEVAAAAVQGATILGYVADATRSRILGGVRCFTDPPAPGEVTAALDAQPRGGKRMIMLSDDIDAFIPAKAELSKLGYSTSMACDDKQAIDLLALLNPDAVLVDLRATPEAAAAFVDGLAPESGRILTMLVHGDPARGALRRALERLLRPGTLNTEDLSRVCRGIVATATATANKQGGVSPLRQAEPGNATARRTAANG
ncbi:MAG TPA: hypothetical protein VGK30_04760 [Candidatus Binatia bacterium]|jgi:hypothetical protein